MPINTRLRPDEIRYQLAQGDVRLLFLADRLLNVDFLDLFAAVARGTGAGFPQPDLPSLAEVVLLGGGSAPHLRPLAEFLAAAGPEDAAPFAAITPDMPALVQFTSGTTSLPKGALLSHGAMSRNASAVAARIGMAPGDRYLSARPFFHVAGTTLSILLSASCGATLVTMTRFEPGEAVRLMEREGCTHFSGNDTMFLMLLDEPRAQAVSRLRGGWAAAGPQTMRRAMEELGAQGLVSCYGLSEASPNVAASDHRDPPADRIEGWMRVHEGVDLRIADPETGTALPPGSAGEIQLRGWPLMLEYYRMPAETAASFTPDGYLRTGDLGVLRADGQLRFAGRLKEIIRVGGENVSPQEIESVLLRHPQIAQAQVVGVPDPRLVEVPAAYVVPRAGQTLDPAALGGWLKDRIAGFKCPRHIAVVPSFDGFGMTASSKIRKQDLRADALARFGLG